LPRRDPKIPLFVVGKLRYALELWAKFSLGLANQADGGLKSSIVEKQGRMAMVRICPLLFVSLSSLQLSREL
jgi:hypothetical protein